MKTQIKPDKDRLILKLKKENMQLKRKLADVKRRLTKIENLVDLLDL